MFPILQHIDQVLPAVAGRQDFVVRRRDGYTVIDYVFAAADSFDNPIRRECRGLKFGPDGKIIARPFHKFFNLGEKPETTGIDVTRPHVVMDKLDGSMIHPAIVNGNLVFMTRMGVTDVALAALEHATQRMRAEVLHWCEYLLGFGITPIFEFTAPGNRIVLRYERPELTLLAVRDNVTGAYLAVNPSDLPDELQAVRHHPVVDNLDSFVAATRALKDAEGYVLRFDDGLMVKLKADDYVLRHKAKDGLGLEKNALRLVLEGLVDDTLPLLPPDDAAALRRYENAVAKGIASMLDEVTGVAGCRQIDRKRFAMEVASTFSPLLKPVAFIGYDGGDMAEALKRRLLAQTLTGPRVEELRRMAPIPAWADFYQAPEEL